MKFTKPRARQYIEIIDSIHINGTIDVNYITNKDDELKHTDIIIKKDVANYITWLKNLGWILIKEDNE